MKELQPGWEKRQEAEKTVHFWRGHRVDEMTIDDLIDAREALTTQRHLGYDWEECYQAVMAAIKSKA